MSHRAYIVATGDGFSAGELAAFKRDGFIIARNLCPSGVVDAIRGVADRALAGRVPPLELEADLGYPGAEAATDTIRRLRQAYQRDAVFRRWLSHPGLVTRLRQLLGRRVLMPLAHHNCIMTKHPRHSSGSLWHQDIRYWRYSRRELITAWLALGREHAGNGGLQLIPGSHRLNLAPERFDEQSFLRQDHPDNQPLLAQRQAVELDAGDVLFFHCRLLHAATRNHGNETKYAAVFTFRSPDDQPEPGTRSDSGDVPIPPGAG